MTKKTVDLGAKIDQAELGEEDAKNFLERLDTFRHSLPDAEKSILAQMVIDALGEPVEKTNGEPTKPQPTQESIDSFTEKLNRFHDELPGDQHLYVDDLLARTWYQDQAEVQGYHWVRIGPWRLVPNDDREWYTKWCFQHGGDTIRWMKRYPQPAHMTMGCFANTHT